MTTAKNGLSAKTVRHALGTSHRTAWKMLHQFRIAMVQRERAQDERILTLILCNNSELQTAENMTEFATI